MTGQLPSGPKPYRGIPLWHFSFRLAGSLGSRSESDCVSSCLAYGIHVVPILNKHQAIGRVRKCSTFPARKHLLRIVLETSSSTSQVPSTCVGFNDSAAKHQSFHIVHKQPGPTSSNIASCLIATYGCVFLRAPPQLWFSSGFP